MMKVVFHKNSKEPFNLYRYLMRKSTRLVLYYGDFNLFGRNYENYHVVIEDQVYLFTLCTSKPFTLLITQPEDYPETTDSWSAYNYLRTGEVCHSAFSLSNFEDNLKFYDETSDMRKDDPVYLPDRLRDDFRCDKK